ncbi:hypothetical protein, partial [Klebsiella pneumoniae]|uniref:hypothetical protein n=1 Tax=Klebsiella pneumoniae TaxID=573 RepID=UPI003135FD40
MGHVYMTIERKDVIVKKSFKFNHLIMVAKGAEFVFVLSDYMNTGPFGAGGLFFFFFPITTQWGDFFFFYFFFFFVVGFLPLFI